MNLEKIRSALLGDSPKARYLRFVVVVIVILYVVFIEPYNLRVTENTFNLFEGNGSTITVIFIADIHDAYNHPGFFAQVIESINKQEPDLVLIGGDSVQGLGDDLSKLEPLGNLSSRHGVYAVLGNHDYGYLGSRDEMLADKVEDRLEGLGIDVLRNENKTLKIDGKEFALIGLDDLWAGNSDYANASSGVPDNMSKIILAHNQLSVKGQDIKGQALVLSGHTHCGHIRLPFVTDALMRLTGFADVSGGRTKLDENTELYVTCGVLPGVARLFAPPEVSVLYLE